MSLHPPDEWHDNGLSDTGGHGDISLIPANSVDPGREFAIPAWLCTRSTWLRNQFKKP